MPPAPGADGKLAPNRYPALAHRDGAAPVELAGRGLPEVGGTADRVANVALTIVPLLLVGFAAWKACDGALRWPDLVAFALTYVPIGFGVTVGFHRLLPTAASRRAAPCGGSSPGSARPRWRDR